MKLTRAGNNFAGYYSTDGTHWTQVGGTTAIAMDTTAQAGLAVTAYNNNALNTATFTNVNVAVGFTTALSHTGWSASASSTTSGSSPANALDGNAGTRWSTGAHQRPGQ